MSNEIPEKFLSGYNANEHEQAIYQKWLASDFFNPDTCIKEGVCDADAETFSIVLPPPNVTGILHVGHSLMLTLEDIMVRYNRMRGKRTLWVPGTDHASIATESKVNKLLSKEKTNKHKMGREAFLERVREFAQNSHDTIASQMKRMGASLDWSREYYTLDSKREHAVEHAFKKMYEDGLIYRGDRIVNWDPKGQTTISDDEIVRVEETTKFYYFRYGPFTIGTARPETKFGDKYVVMHPDDERYADYAHGQEIEVEWINGPIVATIIKDEAANPEFGTGVMTITPWHSQIDFEIAERHNLDKEQIIDKYGKLMAPAMEFEGMKISDAREKIVEKLAAKGLVEKIEEGYVHQLATAERTGGIIEPQIMHQWFLDVTKEFSIPHSEIPGIASGQQVTLKSLMQYVVREGHIEILPERFSKTYFHWIDNLRDWCLSRQIWFGHRIPVWYKGDEIHVGKDAPDTSGDWKQDPDTLDTWFSAGLLSFSPLGWPDGKDFTDYHPTSVLETGYDILFFWVAKMILMSTYLTGQIPFKTVYLHGLVRDEQGRKISKSLGNNINPVDMIDKYGADALRMAQTVAVGPGNDNNLGENKIKAYKKFSNKLWNIARFVMTSIDMQTPAKPQTLNPEDVQYMKDLKELTRTITDYMSKYRFYLAADDLYHYIWHTFADQILESIKTRLSENPDDLSAKYTLHTLFVESLKLLHPFMPFITETIWQELPKSEYERELLLVTPWPKA